MKDSDLILLEEPKLTLADTFYLKQALIGLGTTMKHMLHVLSGTDRVIQYPEETRDHLPPEQGGMNLRTYRGVHRLNKDEDGRVKCVACFMCSTACPARCINIVAEESDRDEVEKRPAKFEIDLLLCVFCGFCVEACPCDAIRMDTTLGVMVSDNRADFVLTKDKLMDWAPADYPATDTQSQKAPGGSLHAKALEDFNSGNRH